MGKIQIRQGVFETNSSSTHAIAIRNEKNVRIPKSITVRVGEFGWEFEDYYSMEDKLSYLWTAMLDNNEYCYYRTKEAAQEFMDRKERELSAMLKGIGVNEVIFEDNYYSINQLEVDKTWYIRYDGYVDHANELSEFIQTMKDDSELLKLFLFSNSAVYTGNDNTWSDDNNVEVKCYDCIYRFYKGN